MEEHPLAVPIAEEGGSREAASAVEALPRSARLAFAPLHKRALGTAVGVVAGGGVLLLTLVHVVLRPEPGITLSLLGQYFQGYAVSLPGAAVGAGWGFVVGFVAGWFAAFCRNLVLAVLLLYGRTRAELTATRDFLDHI